MLKRPLPLLLLISALVVGGCGSCFGPARDGNSAFGYFGIGPTVDVAQGTVLDVVVVDAHDGDSILTGVGLADVESSDPSVIEIDDFSDESISLSGVSEGRTSINFSGISSGERRDDRFNRNVVEPTAFNLFPGCANEAVVRGRPAAIEYGFSPASKGRGRYPVAFEPEGAATVNLELSTSTHMVIDVAIDAPDQFRIVADPDDTLAVSELTMSVVDDAPVESLNVLTPSGISTDRPNPASWLSATVTLQGGIEVCTIYPVVASVSSTCGLFFDGAITNSASGYWTEMGLIALNEGTCIIEFVLSLFGTTVVGETTSNVLVPSAPPTSSGGGGGGGGGFDFD